MIEPNPNNGTFTIKLNYVTTRTSFELYDQNGVKICQDKIVSIEQVVNAAIPAGTYILRILEDNRVTSSREMSVVH